MVKELPSNNQEETASRPSIMAKDTTISATAPQGPPLRGAATNSNTNGLSNATNKRLSDCGSLVPQQAQLLNQPAAPTPHWKAGRSRRRRSEDSFSLDLEYFTGGGKRFSSSV